MSLPSRFRVLVVGSSAPGSAGSGICLTHTTTFMADSLCSSTGLRPNGAPGTVAAHCEAAARRQLVRVVGHGPGPGRHHQGAVRRPRRDGGRDDPPGPRHPPGPGRGRRRRRRGGGARRRRHAQRGRQRPGRHRDRPRRPARAARPTSSPAPSASPTTPSRPPACCSTPSPTTRSAGWGWARSTAATSSSTSGIGFDAAVVSEVERRGSLKRFANHLLFGWAAFDTWLRRYDRQRPHFSVRVPGRGHRRRRAVHRVPQHRPLHLHRHPPLHAGPRGHPRPGPRRRERPHPRRRPAPRAGRIGPRLGRHACAGVVTSSYRTDVTEADRRWATARCPTRSTATTSATWSTCELRHEPDVLRLVIPR